MKPRTIEVEVTETLTVKKTVTVPIPSTLDFDPEERDDDALSEIEQLARHIAYQELAVGPDSTWELVGSDGPEFQVGECKFDYSSMTADDEARILGEIVSVSEALEVGDVESILREELNNEVIDRMEQDGTDFETAFDAIISEMKTSQLLSYPGVFEELREEFNNRMLDIWAEED